MPLEKKSNCFMVRVITRSFLPFYKKFVPIQKIGPDGNVMKEMVEVPEEYRLMASDVTEPVRKMINYQCKDL